MFQGLGHISSFLCFNVIHLFPFLEPLKKIYLIQLSRPDSFVVGGGGAAPVAVATVVVVAVAVAAVVVAVAVAASTVIVVTIYTDLVASQDFL